MAESNLSQTFIAYSTLPEAGYSDGAYVLASDFTPTETLARLFPVPDQEKVDNRDAIGRGTTELPTEQKSGFAIPTSFELNHRINVGSFVYLVRRFMGAPATAPSVVEATKAWLHTLYQSNPDVHGLQQPSSAFVYRNNEYDLVHYGGVGGTLNLSQAGTAPPVFTLAIVCSGLYRRISTLAGFGSLALPSSPKEMYGTSTAINYTNDAAQTKSLTNPVHKARNVSFTANNNLDTGDTRMGMPQLDAAEPKRGWYRDFLLNGDREIGGEIAMGFDSTWEWQDASDLNKDWTNFEWLMKGDYIPTTAANNKYSVKLVIPKFTVRAPRASEERSKMVKTFGLVPEQHAGHYGGYRIEVVNGISTAMA